MATFNLTNDTVQLIYLRKSVSLRLFCILLVGFASESVNVGLQAQMLKAKAPNN